MKSMIILGLSILFIVTMSSCRQKAIVKNDMVLDQDLREKFEIVSRHRIFFGHKSVGDDIVDGLRLISTKNAKPPLKILLIDQPSADTVPAAYFLHAKIGKNGDCISKAAAFSVNMDDVRLKDVEVVLFKFCFIDFNTDTNVDSVFSIYADTLKMLEGRFPRVKFIYATVPLLSRYGYSGPIKGRLKELFGMKNDNIVRARYNNKIRQTFPERRIFDIARIECTDSEGNSNFDVVNGDTVYHLFDEYSYDGGHLNQIGQKLVAQGLIKSIVATLEE